MKDQELIEKITTYTNAVSRRKSGDRDVFNELDGLHIAKLCRQHNIKMAIEAVGNPKDIVVYCDENSDDWIRINDAIEAIREAMS